MNQSSCVFEIIDKTLKNSNNRLSVSYLCKIAGVSRSGYYAWVKAKAVRQAQEERDRKDFELILTAFKRRGYEKGARSIYMELIHQNPPVIMNIKKIRRLMKKFLVLSHQKSESIQHWQSPEKAIQQRIWCSASSKTTAPESCC